MTSELIYLTIAQSIIFIAYIAWIWAKYGIQPSISDSWYMLQGTNKEKYFTLFLFSIGVLLILTAGYTSNIFYFLAGACLCFTGGAAAFKKKMTRTLHGIGAIGGIGFSFTGHIIEGFQTNGVGGLIMISILLLFLLSVSILRIGKLRDLTWWVEINAFIYIEIGFMHLILLIP